MDGDAVWFQVDDRSNERPPPPDDASELDWLLYEQEQVLTRRQALDHVSAGALRHMVSTGRWRSPRTGVLIAHSGPLSPGQQLWAAVFGAKRGALLAGLTAARAGGLRRQGQHSIHLLVPAGTRRGRADGRGLGFQVEGMPQVILHRSAHLPASDILGTMRPPRTTMARSLVDAAQWAANDDDARAIVAAACQQNLVAPMEIVEVLQRMPRAHRRSVMLETVAFAEGGADALSEIDFSKLCLRFRLPTPDRQVVRTDRRGRKRYLDAYWEEFRLHVEVDGAWHTDVDQWWADMRRQNDLWISGDRILRFPAWLIRQRPAEVAEQLRAALTVAGWRP